ncbi:MAG: hypothetical protein Aurels2KO_34190 [Aureliella sp.]
MVKLSKFIAAVGCALVALAAQGIAQDTTNEQTSLPMTNSASVVAAKPLTLAQQRARYAADQRVMRIEFNNAIGYSPLRPNLSAGYMGYVPNRYFIQTRQAIVTPGHYSWYW